MHTDVAMIIHTRAAKRGASLAVAMAVLALAMASAAFAQEASRGPSPSTKVINGWVGARGGPAGLYSFTVGVERAWMHNVNVGEGWDPVEITFQSARLADNEYGKPTYYLPVEFRNEVAWDGPYSQVPQRVGDERVQVWVMDVAGTRVVVTIKSYPNTPAELVAEAERIVGSIYVEPGLGRRVVFTLPDGWDSG